LLRYPYIEIRPGRFWRKVALGFARKFLLNLTYLAAGDLAAKAFTFLAFTHIARVVGTGAFGDLSFATAFTLYFALIVRQGFDVYGIQEIARNRSRIRELCGNILGLRLALSVGSAIILAAILPLLGKPSYVKVLLLLNGLSFFTSALSCTWIFQAMEQMKVVAISNVMSQAIFCAATILFLKSPEQLFLVPLLQVAGETVMVVYLFFRVNGNFGRVRLAFDKSAWTTILKESLPMGLSITLSLVMLNFDIILLGFLKPASEVGQYSAAYKVIGLFSSLVLLYNRNLLPAISRCRGNPKELQSISMGAQRYALLLTIPLAAGGTLLSRPLIQLLFGDQFIGGAAALGILIWIIPASSSRALYRSALMSHGYQNENMWISMVAVVVNVILNVTLIPFFSYFGSAVASLASELVLLFLLYRCVKQKIALLPLVHHIWKPAFAGVIMSIFVVWSDSFGLFARIIGGFVIYALVGLALKAFNLREISKTIGLS
jgi:O-antigen/teichoic acid export membrane protein